MLHNHRKKTLVGELLELRQLLTGVVINEIHYDPDVETEQVEFIELLNAGDAAEDLSGWRIDAAVDFSFPDQTILEAGDYFVVTQDSVDFRRKFGRAADGEWEQGDKLRNEGERIALFDAVDEVIDEVTYGLGFPWPIVGDHGRSIELRNPHFDNALPGNWSASLSTDERILIAEDSQWRYRKGVSNNPPATWNEVGFLTSADNVNWLSGQAGIGYGDNDDKTALSDMRNGYSSVYFRHDFEMDGELPDQLQLRLYVDDGAIVYLNGQEVARRHVSAGVKRYNSTAINHEAAWETVTLNNLESVLVNGTNTLAIHALNQSLDSSDFSFNAALQIATSSLATPGLANTALTENVGPQLGDLRQSIQQPRADDDVVISVAVQDSDGIQAVNLEYQIVEPGSYIRLDDQAYDLGWQTIAMRDDGIDGDALANDGVFSATLSNALHEHRHLVRYRILATDQRGMMSQGPRADDPQPNFAYFVYDGIPAWEGSNRGTLTSAKTTFPVERMDNGVAPYFLLANRTDVSRSQYSSSFRGVRFQGTMVYDGVVYDHVEFSNRGEASTYVSGKNKWRVDFLRGHDFAARDNYGDLYQEKWRRLTLNANASPWSPRNRGISGLDEAVSNRIFQLAGVEAPNTNYVQFRVIDDADEAPGNQYNGDLWGLYLAVEHTGGRFLDEHGLAEGNVYEIEGGNGEPRHLAADLPSNGSDWTAIKRAAQSSTTTEAYWRDNFNLDAYYSFRGINRVVGNVDVRDGANYVMYHAPDGRWEPIPWDLDMMYVPETHWSGQTYFASLLRHDALELEFRNRSRELLDLMFSDPSRTGGQVAQLVDEFARFVNPVEEDGSYGTGWAELDQYLWNYHPRTASNHRGAFFRTPMQEQRRGGTWTRRLDTPDFDGMVKFVIDFMTDTDSGSWRVGDGDQRGYGYNYLEFEAQDSAIPFQPSIESIGPDSFPIDDVRLSTSAFDDPNGSDFATMEWRLAEISNPSTPDFDPNDDWRYEVDAVWESGELDTFQAELDVPASSLEVGRTYRARVRMKDDTGRWSHWSEPIEFLAAEPIHVPGLAITEIHYHPANNAELEDEDDQEFLEVFNLGDTPINLSGYRIEDFANEPYVFADGVEIGANEYVVIARSPVVFEATYGSDFNVVTEGYGPRSLRNSGETVTLVSPSEVPVSSVTYSDDDPWPVEADGDGYSLEIVDPRFDGNDANNWRASLEIGGSPGRLPADRTPGDANEDGEVSFADFLILSANFGQVSASWEDGDFNEDGNVNFADFLLLSRNFGNG